VTTLKYYSHIWRFRISRPLLVCIIHVVENHDDYFVQKRNAAYKLRLSCLQKITVAFCMLCNGVATNITDEYVYIGESTAIKSMRRLIISVVELFEDEYLRTPNQNDTTRLLAHCGGKKFPGHARMYRLYALKVEELSYNMAQYVLRSCSSANNNIKSCCI
jgi:hypothetical protein